MIQYTKIYEATVMVTGDNKPGNNIIPTNNFGTQETILLIVLFCIILVMFVIMFVIWIKMQSKINKLQEQFQKDITDEETTLLLKYRKLNNRGKNIVQDTVKTLADNITEEKE